MSHQLGEGFGRSPVFLALVGRQLQSHDGDGQVQRFAQAARIVLDQFGRAGGTDQHGLRRKAVKGLAGSGLEKFGSVAAQVTRFEGGVGDRRALLQALDHGEEQVCIGVALRRVQHIVHAFHGGCDTHRAHMGRSFVGPQGQLHGGKFLRRPGASGAAADG